MKKEEMRCLLKLDSSIDITKIEEEKGEINIHVKSKKKKVRCPYCNNFSDKIHDYLKPSKVNYLKTSEQHTSLIVYKRRFECKFCNKSFTEDLGLTNKNQSVSLKLKQLILKDCLNRDKTIKQISIDNKVSETTVRAIFLEAMKNYPDEVKNLPEVISLDEVSTYTEEGVYSVILNDPIHRITLDILPSRRKEALLKYFLKVNNRASVKAVICDLYKTYYEVVKICFPNAIFVADPFHYISYVSKGLDKVRIRLVHKYENDKKSKNYKIVKNRLNTGLLLKSFNETKVESKKREELEKRYDKGLTKKKPVDKYNDYWYGKVKVRINNKMVEVYRIDRLNEVLGVDKDLQVAYTLKEEFLRIIYNVKYENAKEELQKWIKKCKDSGISEMIEASKTIENWLEPIVNSFLDERYSNGFTEANNNTIDKIVDIGYGYKNFKFFRLRTLAILHQSYSSDRKVFSKKDKK